LSRLSDVLVQRDIETVVLAFRHADRGDFFGALDACHDHWVVAKVHRRFFQGGCHGAWPRGGSRHL